VAKPAKTRKITGNVTRENDDVPARKRAGQYVLTLYVAGNNIRSRAAIENVREICEENLKGRYELEIIDIYQDRAKKPVDRVLAAPTLIRELPLPIRRVTGDMTRKEKVLAVLDLLPRCEHQVPESTDE
jgi:circadian clock protein KaiB